MQRSHDTVELTALPELRRLTQAGHHLLPRPTVLPHRLNEHQLALRCSQVPSRPVRVGVVSFWFNRGQGVVGRMLRDTLRERGHETFVLARPAKERFVRPGFIARGDVWDRDGVTEASDFNIPYEEYASWAEDNSLDVILCDQNYQFEELTKLRRAGITTIGRFVWESFGPHHVAQATRAFTAIYSFTRAEQARYATMGIDSPRIPFGCHPELLEVTPRREPDTTSFFYPAGYLSARKPTGSIVEAFATLQDRNARLLIKAQRPLRPGDLIRSEDLQELKRRRKRPEAEDIAKAESRLRDRRIRVLADDLATTAYYDLFASHHACVAVSRWEGLGLHLFEAMAFGLPVVTNDDPPMNEIVRHGANGLLVKSRTIGRTPSGIEAREPDVDSLANALHELTDPAVREKLSRGALETREQLNWRHTGRALDALLIETSKGSG